MRTALVRRTYPNWSTTDDTLKTPTRADAEDRKAELPMIKEHLATFGDKLPKALADELSALEQRLG